MIRAAGNRSRSSSPSPTVATQSAFAPSSSAVSDTVAAPCPYASAFTTAQSSAPAERLRQPSQVGTQGVAVDRDLGAHLLAGPWHRDRG